jgi:serine/threonine-protein kinase
VRGEKGDDRSDLFSLGVLLYEMLSGANPFAGASASECIDRVLRMSPPKLSGMVPGLPPGLSRLVSELTDKDPGRRPGSAEEAAERLEPYAFVTGEGVARLLADPRGYQVRREDQQALERISRRERRSQALSRFLTYFAMLAVSAAAVWSAAKWGLPALTGLMSRPLPAPSQPPVDSPAVAVPTVPEQSGRIRVSGTTGARVYLDGEPKGRIPFSAEGVKPGRVQVRAELDGYQPYERMVAIQPRQTLDLAVELAPAAREPGYLALAVTPWAEVYVDGKLADRTPLTGPMKLEAGRRQLLLRHPNRRDYAREVEIMPGDTLRLEVAMPQAWGYLAVTATPWAKVFVDGEAAGTTPLANPLRLSIGQHEVRLEGPGGSLRREVVRLAEGETLAVRVEMK